MQLEIEMRIHFLAFLSPLLLSGCQAVSEKPVLVASFYPIYHLVQSIAGDRYEVVCMVSGQEPHEYEPTMKMMTKLIDAKAVFINGLGMEAWEDRVNEEVASKMVPLSSVARIETVDGRVDPHVWLDTRNYLSMGQAVYQTLVAVDPLNSDYFTANFASFSKKVRELEDFCSDLAATFNHKAIAVAHAAYGYMCNQFGIEQLYINGLSPEEEPTPQAIVSITEAIQARGIDTIFFEENASPAVASYVASLTGAKCDSLNPLETLDAEEQLLGEDYFSVYAENFMKIAEAKP